MKMTDSHQRGNYTICFYSDAKGFGGAEKYLIYLAEGLADSGRKCCFITNSANIVFTSSINQKFTKFQVSIKSDKYYETRHYGQISRILKNVRPDIFHYNLPGPYSCSMLVPVLAKLAGVKKVITTEHLPMIQWWRKPAIFKRISSFFIDAVITVSLANKPYLLSRHHTPENKIKVVQNGIDVHHFAMGKYITERVNLRKKYNFAESDIVFGVVGRLEEQKGHIYALQALSKIHKNCPSIRLIFFGEGILSDYLKKKAVELGVEQKVTFAGFQKEMAPAYACIDVLLMPSLFEGLPLALLEAMSMGRPAIATAIHGIPEVIENYKNGFLVQVKNSDEISNAMIKIWESEDRKFLEYIGKKAYETIISRFSSERMILETDLLNKALIRND
ncbi:glycosyltransferase family 1 protein [Candidatus Parcubacteria bacterium]|nr:MAG: glycosyltransferase family 1 protein [Candidatus Parcubacteria bacterium]